MFNSTYVNEEPARVKDTETERTTVVTRGYTVTLSWAEFQRRITEQCWRGTVVMLALTAPGY